MDSVLNLVHVHDCPAVNASLMSCAMQQHGTRAAEYDVKTLPLFHIKHQPPLHNNHLFLALNASTARSWVVNESSNSPMNDEATTIPENTKITKNIQISRNLPSKTTTGYMLKSRK